MFPEPEYAQNIIVGVIFRNAFSWYVTERDYWYLDYLKYNRALVAAGHTISNVEEYADRFGIVILNENTAESFLMHIKDHRVPSQVLSQMMLEQRKRYEACDMLDSRDYYEAKLDFNPCFLVNFDLKQFSSQYPEMTRFENYVPDSWTGAYRDFLSEIPEAERYWILDGQNVFESQ
ncbi:MAG TPA: hypothetical protein VFV38_42125 [Ktedonobacteraceae bacterium]|nr:hypothetical protein [Ktedonobacteraceae bacterium]